MHDIEIDADNDGHDSEDVDVESEVVDNTNINEEQKGGDSPGPTFSWGHAGRVGLAKVKVSKKVKADRTVSARLGRLEQSLSILMESQTTCQPIESKPADETLEKGCTQIRSVENIIHGFRVISGMKQCIRSKHHKATYFVLLK